MNKSTIYFEQFLAGLFLFKGRDISHEEIADTLDSYLRIEDFELVAKEDVLYNLADFVEVHKEGFRLKEGISLDAELIKGYTIADHFIVNTGKRLYNFMHARFSEDEYGDDPYEKVMKRYKKRN